MPTNFIQEKLALQEIPVLPQVFRVPTMLSMSIHRRIYELRTQKKMTMQSLGKLVGVTWQTVQQWEREDGTAPKRTRLEKVAAALGTTTEYLLHGADTVLTPWPFEKWVPYSRIESLDADDLGFLGGQLLAAIERLEAPDTKSPGAASA